MNQVPSKSEPRSLSGWWFQALYFLHLRGNMIQFDEPIFSDGLVQPPTTSFQPPKLRVFLVGSFSLRSDSQLSHWTLSNPPANWQCGSWKYTRFKGETSTQKPTNFWEFQPLVLAKEVDFWHFWCWFLFYPDAWKSNYHFWICWVNKNPLFFGNVVANIFGWWLTSRATLKAWLWKL